jgi:hypothetical protein
MPGHAVSADSQTRSSLPALPSTAPSPGEQPRVSTWSDVCCTPTAGRSFVPGSWSASSTGMAWSGPWAGPGRAGAAGDNAPIGSFFSLLQKNVLNRRSWNTREHMRIAIVTWIERTHHRRRRQVAIGRLTPVEYELIMTTTATRAAKLKLSPVRAADPASKRW